ncbi:S-layer homology domain-containing protein [Ohessyouella blattaphilus]|uniref:S-layer homology domain-containing protein n=1 Tax=Ohessyouella blattaphilus TaxID=2949333 RepID=A0ABT1ED64_9FIRM|nr:S-layer homology domain-containing protein [Ohessyouella blattaphilus]MCP1108633.1 S-layer homology domain-containing protein [Ohessyouella blattaphilus]MCR8562027.1 S-layer homology domain-containing protein [Ohessyouella blattaphilus]
MRAKKENKCKGLWLVIAVFCLALLMTQVVVKAADADDRGDYQDQSLERIHEDDEFIQQQMVENAEYNQMSSDDAYIVIRKFRGDGYAEIYSQEEGNNPDYAGVFNYDVSTGILTVNSYQGGWQLELAHHNENPLKVVFKGKNYFDEIELGSGDYIFGGDGEVNCSSIFVNGPQNFTVESGLYNIVQNFGWGSYYGINMWSSKENHPWIKILGGTVNITSKGFASSTRVGIDAQEGNLEIRNANVNIDLGSAQRVFGLASGLTYAEGEFYGGGLIIENSNINIKTAGTVYSYSIYAYTPQLIGEMSYYVGPRVANKKIDVSKVFTTQESMNNRQVCYDDNLIISTTPIDVDIAFDDVKVGDWYYAPVKSMFQKGIMTGIDDYTFGSTQNLARAQFAALLYKLEGSPAVAYESRFSDVADGQWYTKPILWAAQNGIVNGYQDGRFGVGDSINREQIATMLYSYSKFKGYDLSQSGDLSGFPDNSNVSAYAKKSLQWAVGVGFISGTNGKLDPQGSAVRAQCATIMMRYLKAYE